jgi:hypothetical protein
MNRFQVMLLYNSLWQFFHNNTIASYRAIVAAPIQIMNDECEFGLLRDIKLRVVLPA